MITYRIYETLKALQENPDGLTMDEIFKACRSKQGSEIPNDRRIMNSIIYYLRVRREVNSIDSHRGRVHKLSNLGLQAIQYYEEFNSEDIDRK